MNEDNRTASCIARGISKEPCNYPNCANCSKLEAYLKNRVQKTTPLFCDAQICNELLKHCDSCASNTELRAKIDALKKQAGIQ